ncbi:MAG: hypothetical protein AAB927_00065 [Patescibacteria group bacterium]
MNTLASAAGIIVLASGGEVWVQFPKKETSWCYALSSEGSESDTADLSIHKAVPWAARSTRVSVVNANWNGNRWNRNRYSLDNDNVWNVDNRLVLGNWRLSPAQLLLLPGVFFSI